MEPGEREHSRMDTDEYESDRRSHASNLDTHPDRLKWNEKHRKAAEASSFQLAPLLDYLTGIPWPEGPVLELACGLSGNALAVAQRGRQVLAVDISDVALEELGREAERRDLRGRVSLLQADLLRWEPGESRFALVLCTRYWERSVFERVAQAVRTEGLLAWETFRLEHLRYQPSFPREWCLNSDEPGALLPAGFISLLQEDLDDGRTATRRFVARR
jgi:SAM-dependent methyltransferase